MIDVRVNASEVLGHRELDVLLGFPWIQGSLQDANFQAHAKGVFLQVGGHGWAYQEQSQCVSNLLQPPPVFTLSIEGPLAQQASDEARQMHCNNKMSSRFLNPGSHFLRFQK
jgi:hypothetical protein